MKRKEKTVLAGRSNTELELETFNSTAIPQEKGQKLQVSVRLESETIDILKKLGEDHDISFSETVRRIIRQELTNSKSKISSQGGSP